MTFAPFCVTKHSINSDNIARRVASMLWVGQPDNQGFDCLRGLSVSLWHSVDTGCVSNIVSCTKCSVVNRPGRDAVIHLFLALMDD